MKALVSEKAEVEKAGKVSTSHSSDSLQPIFGSANQSSPSIFRKATCACGGGCSSCQASTNDLKISQPNDPAEIEADQIADRVMRMPKENVSSDSNMQRSSKVDGNNLQRKSLPSSSGIISQSSGHVQNAMQSGGRPLELGTRNYFEPRLGYDLSSVRLHTDAKANESAHALNAKAYTVGKDIVFGRDEYKTNSEGGNRLLAHELAHVTQNNSVIHRDEKPDAVVDPVEVRLEGLPEDGLKLMAKSTRVDANIIDKEMVKNGDLVFPEFGVHDNQGKTWAWINVPSRNAIDVPINKLYAKDRRFNYPILHGFIEFKYLGNITIHITIYAKPPVKIDPPAPVSLEPPKRDKPAAPETQSAKDLINHETSWYLELNEEALGKKLLEYADGGNFSTPDSVLEELGSSDRDDVSFELIKASSEEQLSGMAETEQGRKFLDRLYDELTSGSADEAETVQAERILMAKARRIDPEKFMNADKYAMVIPFSASGFTKFNSASLSVHRMDNGNIWVRSHMTGEHYPNSKISPEHYAIMYSGMEMDPDTVVGLYLYDDGGKIIYMPALYLLQLSNSETTKIGTMAGEAFLTGLTLGAGGEAVAIAEGANASRAAIWGARAFTVLKWTDRAAAVFAAASTIINEHRGWIIEKFGEDGREFLKDWAKVDRILMIYGLARGAVALGQMGWGLRASYKNWRSAADKLDDLAEDEKKIVNDLASNTESTIEEIETAQNNAGMGTKAATTDAAKQMDEATDDIKVLNKNDITVSNTGKATGEVEEAGAEVVELDKYRQQKSLKQKARQPAQQMKKTGTDDTVAVAQDAPIAANDNVEIVSDSTTTTTGNSTRNAKVTPINGQPKVDLSEFTNGAKLEKDKWIGKKWKKGDPLPEGYVSLEDGGIRRGPGFREKNYVPLEVKEGKLVVGTGGERISNPSVMNRNYKKGLAQDLEVKNPSWSKARLEKEVAKEVEKNAVHHLIPDNVVQDHPLAQAARDVGYDLDNSENLIGLPKSKSLTDIEAGEMGHWTSHPQYDKIVKDELTKVQKLLEKKFGSLDKVPKQRLMDAMKNVEEKLQKLIEDGLAPIKDGHLAEEEQEESKNPSSFA